MSNFSDVISDKIMVYYREDYEREDEAKDATVTHPLATVSKWTLERELSSIDVSLKHLYFEVSIS